jgi:hypothetical protein
VSLTGVLAALLGVALLAYTLDRTGPAAVAEGLSRVGWGFAPILAISGFRFYARASAWRLCAERPAELPVGRAFQSMLVGDAAGSLTPLGLVASESAKLWLTRARLSLVDALSSIAIENLLYTLTVGLVIGAGCAMLLASVTVLPEAVHLVSVTGLVAMSGMVAATIVLLSLNVRMLGPVLGWLERRGWLPSRVEARLAELHDFEGRVYNFARDHRRRLPAIFAWEAAFHAAGVLEILVAITLMTGGWPGLRVAFILEAVNRLITVAFKFVPLRLGVDEAGTGALTAVLGLGPATGVTLAVVRKLRVLAWNGAGLAVLALRPLASRP